MTRTVLSKRDVDRNFREKGASKENPRNFFSGLRNKIAVLRVQVGFSPKIGVFHRPEAGCDVAQYPCRFISQTSYLAELSSFGGPCLVCSDEPEASPGNGPQPIIINDRRFQNKTMVVHHLRTAQVILRRKQHRPLCHLSLSLRITVNTEIHTKSGRKAYKYPQNPLVLLIQGK